MMIIIAALATLYIFTVYGQWKALLEEGNLPTLRTFIDAILGAFLRALVPTMTGTLLILMLAKVLVLVSIGAR